MKNFEYENDFLKFRRANENDDLYVISELIYYTDPYIYPFWFDGDIEEAKKYLPTLLKKGKGLFDINNFYVAIDKSNNHIVALLCAIDKSVDLTYDYEEDKKINYRYKIAIDKYVKSVEDEISNSDDDKLLYISNVCVSDGLRGLRIGSKLMSCFIEKMETENNFEKFELDCLLHNLRAKNLYHSMGFKEVKEIIGFDGTDHSDVEVVNFARNKGNHFEKTFM